MTQVTLDNEIISRQLGEGESYIVGGQSPYDSEGPLLSSYGTDIIAYNDQLGTNGYAYVRNVGVVDLADGSLVSGITFSREEQENVVMTDNGNVAMVKRDDNYRRSSGSFYLVTEHYDCTASSPSLTARSVQVNLPDDNQEYDSLPVKIWYARPSTSHVGLFIQTESNGGNEELFIGCYDFVNETFDAFSADTFLNRSGRYWKNSKFAYKNGGWAILGASEDVGSKSQAFIAQGTGGFTSSTDWDSLNTGPQQNGDWGTGFSVAFDYSALAVYYSQNNNYITEDISGGSASDLNVYLDRWIDRNGNILEYGKEFYSTGNGTYYDKEGTNKLVPIDNNFGENNSFKNNGVTSPHINGYHGFSNRSLKTYANKDSPGSSGQSTVYKLSINGGREIRVNLNGTTIVNAYQNNGQNSQIDGTCYVYGGDEISSQSDHEANISLVRVK